MRVRKCSFCQTFPCLFCSLKIFFLVVQFLVTIAPGGLSTLSFDGSCSLEVPPKSASVLLFFRGLSWRLLASSFVVCICASFRKAWTSSFGIWQAGSQVCPSGPYPFHEINSSRLPPTVLLSIILSTRYVPGSTFRLRFPNLG